MNFGLSADPEGRAGFAELEGRKLGIEVQGWGLRFVIRPHAEGVRIAAGVHDPSGVPIGDRADADDLADADVVIVGTAGALIGMAARARDDDTLPDDLEVTGNVAVAQTLSRVLARLDIDWEALLARVTGDAAAHPIARTARNAAGFGRESLERLLDQSGEYLREEAELAARPYELEDYALEVDRLRDDAARLEQKIARLESRVERRAT